MLKDKINPLKKFGELLRSNERVTSFKNCHIKSLSNDFRKDLVYSDSDSPLTHYWSYYFVNCTEDYSPFEDLIDYYTDTTKRTFTEEEFVKLYEGKDKKFNKWFKKIKPFLHPQFGGDDYSERFGSIDITPNEEVENVN